MTGTAPYRDSPPDGGTELLAPAGSFDAAIAAFSFGADAVYLGLRSHSARAEAVNFSPDELASLCAYAHRLAPRRSVYVAVNTLVRPGELESAVGTLHAAVAAGADGAIVQDLAVASLARRLFPELEIHASTQMCIHSIRGAKAAEGLGFSRIVLARELSLAEIAGICRATDLEVEVFIHGALCYSYSGLCLFSALATGRSGNHGECAYCCRSMFSTPDGQTSFPFSMRDLALGRDVARLRDAGVKSLKIEGRMKGPAYVAAATRLYRMILDGKSSRRELEEANADLQTVFSRPYTSLYLNGANSPENIIDPVTVGHRGLKIGTVAGVARGPRGPALRFRTTRPLELHDGIQIDLRGRPYGFPVTELRTRDGRRAPSSVPAGTEVEIPLPPDAPRLPAGADVFCAASQAARRSLSFPKPRAVELAPKEPVDFSVSIARDGVSASAVLAGRVISVSIPAAADAARDPGNVGESVGKAFARTGESRWEAREVVVTNPDGLFAPASLLNNLRRRMCDALDSARAENLGDRLSRCRLALGEMLSGTLPRPSAAAPVPEGLSVKLPLDAPPRAVQCAELVLAVKCGDCGDPRSLAERIGQWEKLNPVLRIALPPIVRERDAAAVEAAVRHLAGAGRRDWEVCDLSMLHLVREACGDGASIVAGHTLYAMNPVAARALRSLGVSAAVVPAEASRETAEALCAACPDFFIFLEESRPPLFISETRPMAGLDGSGPTALADRHGGAYTVECSDGLWLTRPAAPKILEPPSCALRRRREDDLIAPWAGETSATSGSGGTRGTSGTSGITG